MHSASGGFSLFFDFCFDVSSFNILRIENGVSFASVAKKREEAMRKQASKEKKEGRETDEGKKKKAGKKKAILGLRLWGLGFGN